MSAEDKELHVRQFLRLVDYKMIERDDSRAVREQVEQMYCSGVIRVNHFARECSSEWFRQFRGDRHPGGLTPGDDFLQHGARTDEVCDGGQRAERPPIRAPVPFETAPDEFASPSAVNRGSGNRRDLSSPSLGLLKGHDGKPGSGFSDGDIQQTELCR